MGRLGNSLILNNEVYSFLQTEKDADIYQNSTTYQAVTVYPDRGYWNSTMPGVYGHLSELVFDPLILSSFSEVYDLVKDFGYCPQPIWDCWFVDRGKLKFWYDGLHYELLGHYQAWRENYTYFFRVSNNAEMNNQHIAHLYMVIDNFGEDTPNIVNYEDENGNANYLANTRLGAVQINDDPSTATTFSVSSLSDISDVLRANSTFYN